MSSRTPFESRVSVGFVAAALGLLLCVVTALRFETPGAAPPRDESHAPTIRPVPIASSSAKLEQRTLPTPTERVGVRVEPARSLPDGEPELMVTLRTLVVADPLRALGLARDGERDFGETDHAPERAWVAARALAALGRFHDARQQAQRMVERYPDTVWTEDVRRHLLVNPLDQPSREEMEASTRATPRP